MGCSSRISLIATITSTVSVFLTMPSGANWYAKEMMVASLARKKK